MDFAICTLDNKKYKISDFEKLEPSELAQKRRFLECKCGGPAFFRKASKSGQGACFGARPHKKDCDLSSPENENISGSLTVEEKEFINSGKEIVLDLQYGAIKNKHIVESDDEDESSKNRGTSHSSIKGKANSKLQRRLSTILRTLINEKDFFKDSKQKIHFLSKYPYYAGNFFIHSDYITNDYIDRINPRSYRAIWSMISDVRFGLDNKNLWINTGGNDSISILIDEDTKDDFIRRFKIKDLEDLSGKYVLSISRLKKSKNDKIFSIVEDISYISIV